VAFKQAQTPLKEGETLQTCKTKTKATKLDKKYWVPVIRDSWSEIPEGKEIRRCLIMLSKIEGVSRGKYRLSDGGGGERFFQKKRKGKTPISKRCGMVSFGEKEIMTRARAQTKKTAGEGHGPHNGKSWGPGKKKERGAEKRNYNPVGQSGGTVKKFERVQQQSQGRLSKGYSESLMRTFRGSHR